MKLTDLELDLLYGLVDYASAMAYKNINGDIEFCQSNIYIPCNVLNNYKSLDDFQTACDLLMEKLARG